MKKSKLVGTSALGNTGTRIQPTLLVGDYKGHSTGEILDANATKEVINEEIDKNGGGLPKNIIAEEDGIYIEKNGLVYPMSHPDLSTQPSVLPQRFGTLPIKEVLAKEEKKLAGDVIFDAIIGSVDRYNVSLSPFPDDRFILQTRMEIVLDYQKIESVYRVFTIGQLNNTKVLLYHNQTLNNNCIISLSTQIVCESMFNGKAKTLSLGTIFIFGDDRYKLTAGNYDYDLASYSIYTLTPIENEVEFSISELSEETKLLSAFAINDTNQAPVATYKKNGTWYIKDRDNLWFDPDYILIQYIGKDDNYYYDNSEPVGEIMPVLLFKGEQWQILSDAQRIAGATDENWAPVGIQIMSASESGTETGRFMSLLNMTIDGNGTENDNGLRWGPPLNEDVYTANTVITVDLNGNPDTWSDYGFVPADNGYISTSADNTYNGEPFLASPYNLPTVYNQSSDALRHLPVSEIIEHLNYLFNKSSSSNPSYPAAHACSMYAPGFKDHDWYLPTLNELGYVAANYTKVKNTLKFLRSLGVSTMLLDNWYWSQIQFSQSLAWGVSLNSGDTGDVDGYNKGDAGDVLAFVAF